MAESHRNQEFDDATCGFVDTADNTKKLINDVSGITTATTRTVTWPDADVTIPSTFASSDINISTGTIFETEARFTKATSNTGGFTFNSTSGCLIASGATANSYAKIDSNMASTRIFNQDGHFSAFFGNQVNGTDHEFYIGTGDPGVSGTAITFTFRHYGFKIIRASSSTTVSATTGDGTTETATSFTPAGGVFNSHPWLAVFRNGTDVKFYNDNTLGATITTNLPSGTGGYEVWSSIVNNANTAADSSYNLRSINVQMKADA